MHILREAIDKIMEAVADRSTSSHDKSGMYDSGTSQWMPTSYNKFKPHDRPSSAQEGSVSNEHSTFPEIPVSHDATTYMDHLPLHMKNQHQSHHSLTGHDKDDVSVPSQYLYNSSGEYDDEDGEGKTVYAWPHVSPRKMEM